MKRFVVVLEDIVGCPDCVKKFEYANLDTAKGVFDEYEKEGRKVSLLLRML